MNKGSKLLKASGIMAIIIGTLSCIGIMSIFSLFPGIALIFGGLEFMKFAEMTADDIMRNSTTIIIWIVVFFILGGIITGIVALVGYLDAKPEKNVNNGTTEVNGTINHLDKDDILMEKLERLDKMHKDGLITDEEYNNLKNELLNKK